MVNFSTFIGITIKELIPFDNRRSSTLEGLFSEAGKFHRPGFSIKDFLKDQMMKKNLIFMHFFE
jgi:hypothetical protein